MKLIYDRYIFAKKNGILVEYPDPQFKVIDKIIIKDSKGVLPSLVQYYGSDEELIDLTDFNEYGWEFIVGKEKYNSRFALDFLKTSRKEEIGSSLPDIELASKTLFPTTVEVDEDETLYDINYFGTVTIGHQKLLMVNIPRGYDWAELWDTSDINVTTKTLRNNGTILKEEVSWTESALVEAGETGLIPTRDFIPYDELIKDPTEVGEPRTTSMPKILIRLGVPGESEEEGEAVSREVLYSKIVWFVITTGTEGKTNIEDINLTYFSWQDSINPHRKMNQYLLRKDEKAVIDARLSVVENIEHPNFWMDLSSGTLLGNKDLEEHPLLDKVISDVENDTEWKKFISYNKGDEVGYSGTTYVSLVSNNIGNRPGLTSQKWAKKGTLDSSDLLRINLTPYQYREMPGYVPHSWMVIPNDSAAGLSPKKLLIPKDMLQLPKTISIEVNPVVGYCFDGAYIYKSVRTNPNIPTSTISNEPKTYGLIYDGKSYSWSESGNVEYMAVRDGKPFNVLVPMSSVAELYNIFDDPTVGEAFFALEFIEVELDITYSVRYENVILNRNPWVTTRRAAPYHEFSPNYGKTIKETITLNSSGIFGIDNIDYGNYEITSITRTNTTLNGAVFDTIPLEGEFPDISSGKFDLETYLGLPANVSYDITVSSKKFTIRVVDHRGLIVSSEESIVAPAYINENYQESFIPSSIYFKRYDESNFGDDPEFLIQVQDTEGEWVELFSTGSVDTLDGEQCVLLLESDTGEIKFNRVKRDLNIKIKEK